MKTFVIAFIVLAIIVAIIQAQSEKKRKEAKRGLSQSFRAVEGVKLEKKHIARDAKSGIGVSQDGSKILLASRATARTVKVFQAREVVSAEVKVDDITVTKTGRGSQLGGAAVGGVLAGSTGAIIGGLSGKQTSQDEIRKVDLVVVVDSASKPRHCILFYDSEASKNATIPPDPESAVDNAEEWRSTMDVVIRRASSS